MCECVCRAKRDKHCARSASNHGLPQELAGKPAHRTGIPASYIYTYIYICIYKYIYIYILAGIPALRAGFPASSCGRH